MFVIPYTITAHTKMVSNNVTTQLCFLIKSHTKDLEVLEVKFPLK